MLDRKLKSRNLPGFIPRESPEEAPGKKSSSGIQRIRPAYANSSSGVQIGYTRHIPSFTPTEVFCTPAELEPVLDLIQSPGQR